MTALALEPREPPLAPCAVAATGAVARALASRLLRLDDAALRSLSGVAGAGVLVCAGEAERLPWVDGVVYLGNDGGLFVPTTHATVLPAALVRRALESQVPAPAAVWPVAGARPVCVSLAEARPLERRVLLEWLAKAPS